jgi:predicted Zn-ribbon and HTH transcriptional regulator
MVVLGVLPHKWTEWNKTPSTCDTYGSAVRDCESCDARQVLDKDHLEVLDQGKKVSIDNVIPKVNRNYNTSLDGNTYYNKQDFDKALKELKFDYEPEKDWLEDCYTRKITYRCPHCKSPKDGVHPKFTVTLKQPMVVAHVWNTKAQPKADAPAGTDEKTIRSDAFINNDHSLAPTCLLSGFDLYFCQYDATYGEKKDLVDANKKHEHTAKDQYKKVYIDATGHDWTDWVYIETFESKDEGKLVKRYARTCKTCGYVENKNVIEDKPAAKNGLAQDEKGKWHYYKNDEIDKTKTGIVEFEGGEFWVINGDLAEDANGLTICPDGKAYFLAQGQIQRVSQVAEYKGNFFMIKNGLLDESANGLYDYDGGTFVFAAGKLRKDVNGLWQNPKDNKWYFLANGQVQKVSQVASYNGEFFVVKDGVLDTGYNGTIEYDGKTFNVVNGQLYDEVA